MGDEEDLEERLFCALVNGSLDTVERILPLLRNPAAITDPYNGKLLLHYACRHGWQDITVALVECYHCDPEIKDELGRTPLHDACGEGQDHVVRYLITERNCNVTSQDKNGSSLLHLACANGHTNVVKFLIAKKCDPQLQTKHGSTALHLACMYGELEIVQILTAVNTDPQVEDENGNTPLHLSCWKGHLNVAKYLVCVKECDPNCQAKDGNTPLHLACKHGHTEVVKFLIECGCDPHNPNKNGNTPLHAACSHGSSTIEVVKFLLIAQNCESDLKCSNSDGHTPLHLAYEFRKWEIMKFLIHQNYHNQCPDDNGDTLLHWACQSNDTNMVRFLLSTGKVNPFYRNRKGKHPLHLTSKYEIVKMFTEFSGCYEEWAVDSDSSDSSTVVKSRKKEGKKLDGNEMFEEYCRQSHKHNTPLHDACERGDTNVVKFLISRQYCDIQAHNREGYMPFYFAYKFRSWEAMKYLIQNNYWCPDSNGDTPLHWACKSNDTTMVRFLLSTGRVNPFHRNRKDEQPLHLTSKYEIVKMFTEFSGYRTCEEWAVDSDSSESSTSKLDSNELFKEYCRQSHKHNTPLHDACERGDTNVVKFLISRQYCDIQAHNREGYMPFYLAYKFRSWEAMKYFIQNNYWCPDSNGDTPLHWACKSNDTTMVRFLLSTGRVNPFYRNRKDEQPLHLTSKYEIVKMFTEFSGYRTCEEWAVDSDSSESSTSKLDSNELFKEYCRQAHKHNTPLHDACERGDTNVVKFLISRQYCDIQAHNREGYMPFYLAYDSRSWETMKYLIQNNYWCPDSNGDTPLHRACQSNDTDMVTFLLSTGKINTICDPQCRNNDGNTLLHLACWNEQLRVVKLLTEQNCDLQCQNNNGNTPLHLACWNGQLQVVKFLAEQKCDLQCQNNNGYTPLHLACWNGQLQVVKFLAEQNCDLQCQNNDGNAPLHLACGNGHLQVVKFLAERNCDLQCQNNDGNTPLHWACGNGQLLVVKFLTEQNCNPQCQNNDGNTPLHLACIYSSGDIVTCLLSTGRVSPLSKNKEGETPLQWNTDYKISKLLAHAIDCMNKYSLQPTTKVFVLGNAGVGKTTLVKVIENQVTSLIEPMYLAGGIRNVSGVEPKTAGISLVNLQNRRFGKLAIHDLAGHHEYYASHDALIQNIMSASAALFLVVIKMSDPESKVLQTLRYWLSFVENCCSRVNATAHVIVIGSHADVAKSTGDNIARKQNKIEATCQSHAILQPLVQYAGFIPLDCRKLASANLDMMCKLIQTSCANLRDLTPERKNICCHMLYALLVTKFQRIVACRVRDIVAVISEEDDASLPTDALELSALLGSLNDNGHILYLLNKEEVEEGWVVTNKQALLSEINGGIFAPEKFKEHHEISNSTGVVPKSRIKTAFPTHDADMITGILTHFEFCQKVRDVSILSLIVGSDTGERSVNGEETELQMSPDEQYYFFPALVHVDRPEHVWQSDSQTQYRCGWCLQCTEEGQYFTPRFLHILLLRMAFTYALHDSSHDVQTSPVLRRRCSIWKSGIQWLNEEGIQIIVDMVEQNHKLLLFMSCLQQKEMACIEYRSKLIQKILQIKRKFCLSMETEECFVSPTSLDQYPWKETEHVLFSITDIIRVIKEEKDCVVDKTGRKNIKLEELFYFEPYIWLSQQTLTSLLSSGSEQKVEIAFLNFLATDLTKKAEGSLIAQAGTLPIVDKFLRLLGIEATVVCDSRSTLTDLYLHRLTTWSDSDSGGGTYGSLRSILDKYSIFGGRDMLGLELSSNAALTTLPPVPPLQSAVHLDVDESPLGIGALLNLRAELKQSIPTRYELGLALGLDQPTLEEIRTSHGNSGQRLTEILAAWLQRRDRVATPSWQTLCAALQSPTVNLHQLAGRIAESHKRDGPPTLEVPQHSAEEAALLQEVDDTALDMVSLSQVKSLLLEGGGHFSWSDLGLALGLLYGTLKRIEEERRGNFDECLRDVLVKWLQQKDRVRDQGLPSWRSLVGALTHPLLNQRGLAEQIAGKHIKEHLQ